jgi:two-component system sensor histidine kinase QseC
MSRLRSLQARLLALVLALVLGLWAISAAVVWRDARHELDELLDAHLAQAASLLVARQVHELGDDDDDAERSIDAPALHRYAPRVAFQVFHKGQLVLRSAGTSDAPLSTQREGFETVVRDGERWRVFSTRGAEHDVLVHVAEGLGARGAILRAVLKGALWPLLLALPLLALTLWWAVRHGTRPLRELGRRLAERAPQELQPVALANVPAEMAPLLEALNALFARIAALLESERRFTADAAHELRTPIAAIRAQAQVALGESDDAQRLHALQATLQGCDRAARLVDQLLTLARLESGQQAALAPVDLCALAQRVLAELAPQALARGQQLTLDADVSAAPLRVAGNETLLAVLLRNLVDNALRYSPAHAQIEVRLARDDKRVLLQVADSGPGLVDEHLKRLGERFFRVLDAQQSAAQSGSGLGWSIVRRIAAAHGADVQLARSAELGGMKVRISFAAAGP